MMKNSVNRILIIPARSNSKRIKNKNVKLFNGVPIIFYPIDAAKKSKLFNKIHVSTDCNKIKKICEKRGIKTDFLRTKKLSGDHVPLIDVFKFVVEKYKKSGKYFDEIWTLMPCSPLINFKDLIKISQFFKKNQDKVILSVSKHKVPIQWAYKKNKKKYLTPIDYKSLNKRSQDLPTRYYDSGQFVIYPGRYFGNFKKNKLIGYELPFLKSIDIDDEEDWKLAEISYKSLRKNI